jgi:hypothetical protein
MKYFFLMLSGFQRSLKNVGINICTPKMCANARNMCSKEDNFVWVNLKVWV